LQAAVGYDGPAASNSAGEEQATCLGRRGPSANS
jgi:hypothetical protein